MLHRITEKKKKEKTTLQFNGEKKFENYIV